MLVGAGFAANLGHLIFFANRCLLVAFPLKEQRRGSVLRFFGDTLQWYRLDRHSPVFGVPRASGLFPDLPQRAPVFSEFRRLGARARRGFVTLFVSIPLLHFFARLPGPWTNLSGP